MRFALFSVVTQLILVVIYRSFGKVRWSTLQQESKQSKKNKWITLPLEIRPIGCPEILVNKHQLTLHNNTEERMSHILFYLNQFLDTLGINCLLCGISTI
jgi:hypothetical protein